MALKWDTVLAKAERYLVIVSSCDNGVLVRVVRCVVVVLSIVGIMCLFWWCVGTAYVLSVMKRSGRIIGILAPARCLCVCACVCVCVCVCVFGERG